MLGPMPRPLRSSGPPGPAAPSAQGRRRETVRRHVLDVGFARIEDLARELGVSIMTVHRDLDSLARDGWLTKIRGGATANPSALLDAGVQERQRALSAEKAAIAEAAAELCVSGQSLYLDDSTTVLSMAPFLADRMPLVVATNFLPAAHAMSAHTGADVTLLGGQYHPHQDACFGLQTLDAIAQLHADVAFMSTTAVTASACWHRSEMTVMVKRAILAQAGRSVLLVDHAKFGRPAPHRLCGLAEFDVVITDDAVDPQVLRELRRLDLEVIVASRSEHA